MSYTVPLLPRHRARIVCGPGSPNAPCGSRLSTNAAWFAQLPVFGEHFHVLAPERRGHGHTPDVEGPLHDADTAADTIAFLDEVVGGAAHLVGWSAGGIVGLLVAIARADLVRKLVVVGTNYDLEGLVPEMALSVDAMDPAGDDMAFFRDAYIAVTRDGADHRPVFVAKSMAMVTSEPHIDVSYHGRISAPTLVAVGDDDLISLEHTVALSRAIPGSQLAVIPNSSHAVVIEKAHLFNELVLAFLEHEQTPTMMPVRCAGRGGRVRQPS